jgi:hypothetical protein
VWLVVEHQRKGGRQSAGVQRIQPCHVTGRCVALLLHPHLVQMT